MSDSGPSERPGSKNDGGDDEEWETCSDDDDNDSGSGVDIGDAPTDDCPICGCEVADPTADDDKILGR
jgi:hypothetical protein